MSNIIFSQIDVHKLYGGVVPEIASRNHLSKIDSVVSEALDSAGVTLGKITAVAVTAGPGLVGALLVGVSFGKALAYAAAKPLVGVHHIEGHISSVYLNSQIKPPFTCLVVSGGHSHLVYVSDYGKYEILRKTRDDAAGEAFDKTARALGLPYPGGVSIEKLAKDGDSEAIRFPIAMKNEADFSFSGLKSAVINYINNHADYKKEDIAASFQQAVVTALSEKAMSSCLSNNCHKLTLTGGVASNGALRKRMQETCGASGIEFYAPEPIFCTDNAAMIASCGYFNFINGKKAGLDLNAFPSGDLN